MPKNPSNMPNLKENLDSFIQVGRDNQPRTNQMLDFVEICIKKMEIQLK